MGIGVTEIMIILAVLLLIVGPTQLPKMGRGLGESIKEFRQVGKQLSEESED